MYLAWVIREVGGDRQGTDFSSAAQVIAEPKTRI